MNSRLNNSEAKNYIESNCLKKQINNPFQQNINLIKAKNVAPNKPSKVICILNIR